MKIKFDVVAMEKLADEDKFIKFMFTDLKKRNPEIDREQIWKIIFDTNVIEDHLYMDVYSKFL
ncbi:hypothetical protein K7887_22385 (plasmid) [Sutcliffiella horikoshii]|uniref:hypothetical protein n=1 Tax=Sutcliffiella horikoshii TaxID=79883 RepID=UPI001CBAC54C|nr:hypothetical protein [Sutcliffiella horikoshii]UAL49868.1 hypothetical protein K7887_22385 [Sutcliffiella horikoshii]